MSQSLFHFFSDLPYRRRICPTGTLLFERDDPVRSVFWVESGEVHLLRRQADGSAFIMQRAQTGSLLAEASLNSKRYHCAAVAITDARLLAFEQKDVQMLLTRNPKAAKTLCNHLAKEVRRARLRAEIVSLRRVSERFDAWLAWQDGAMPDKGHWHRVAREIGVTPEALYREIARRRKETARRETG